MTTVSTKDPHSLSLRLTMGGFSEPTHHKVGQRRMEVMDSTLKTIRPGYFLFTIPHNSKSNNHKIKMRYTIITTTYVHLELGMI